MTKKEKIKAYRKAAELIRTGKARTCDQAMDKLIGGHWTGKDRYLFQFIMDGSGCWFYRFNNKQMKELRQTILLSCASLIRLKFEIEE